MKIVLKLRLTSKHFLPRIVNKKSFRICTFCNLPSSVTTVKRYTKGIKSMSIRDPLNCHTMNSIHYWMIFSSSSSYGPSLSHSRSGISFVKKKINSLYRNVHSYGWIGIYCMGWNLQISILFHLIENWYRIWTDRRQTDIRIRLFKKCIPNTFAGSWNPCICKCKSR